MRNKRTAGENISRTTRKFCFVMNLIAAFFSGWNALSSQSFLSLCACIVFVIGAKSEWDNLKK